MISPFSLKTLLVLRHFSCVAAGVPVKILPSRGHSVLRPYKKY